MKELFLKFDKAFARALGLKLHNPADDPLGVVELLLSKEWWDDQAWDKEI